MITANTRVVNVGPDISEDGFVAVVVPKSNLTEQEARAAYKAIVALKVSPLFCLASFWVESKFGRLGICHDYNTKSPGNTRSSITGKGEAITTPKGTYIRYPSWKEGFRDLAARLIEPDYVYGRRGLVTVAQILPVFAPPEDNNNPASYIASVVDMINTWIQPGQEVTNPVSNNKQLKIALSAGHHNTDGGSPVEHAITGPLCHYYAEYFRSQGHDVRVITPNDGLGDSTVGLQEVAHQVVVWANAGWVADLYLETHTQGLNDSSVRGCFGIYPDWGSDIDLFVRNYLASRICQAINQAVGIPVYQAGVMSEKSTGVGISGFRLGIFLVTAALNNLTKRLIVEHGAHSNPQDLAILQNPFQQKKIAEASAQAIITYFGDTIMNMNIPASIQTVQMNGHTLGHGMLDYWNRVNIPGVQHPLGLPISEEQDWTDPAGKKFVIQCFERGILGYDSTIADPAYRVQGLIIGPEWVKEHIKAA
jgi:N-acetylmuramoyl-L-alanine amidase